MRKRLPILMALGVGYGIYRLFEQQQREISARQWARAHPSKALVTGASSGIGAVFARALARQGYDVILLARREARLRAFAETLEREYSIKTEIMVVDLACPEQLEQAAGQVAQMDDLELLVNNAGFGERGQFAEIDAQRTMDMVQVNLAAAVRLARAAVPGMIRRGKGGIINVSSMAAFLPAAGNHTYGPTKAYLNFFSKSLQAELEGSGVRVQALCPGYTRSEFHDALGADRPQLPDFLWLDAGDVVAESLRGLKEGRLIVIPGIIYRLVAAVASIPGVAPMISVLRRRLRSAQRA